MRVSSRGSALRDQYSIQATQVKSDRAAFLTRDARSARQKSETSCEQKALIVVFVFDNGQSTHSLLASSRAGRALEEQEFKEAVLAYFFLLTEGPKTESDLDERCERFLKDEFGKEVDFESDDALQKVERLRVVHKRDGVYSAIPLKDALQVLDEQWDKFFDFNNKAHGY